MKPEAKTATGIFLPETAVKELNEAKVLAVGPGAIDKDGKRITPSVQPGDKVLIPQVCAELQSEYQKGRKRERDYCGGPTSRHS
jgi:co-chaperonin GroES (HSP10)